MHENTNKLNAFVARERLTRNVRRAAFLANASGQPEAETYAFVRDIWRELLKENRTITRLH